jgi:uncharacterized protein (DUF2147 family)
MRKQSWLCIFSLILLSITSITQASVKQQVGDIIGFWKTIHEKTLRPESVIAIYQYGGQYFGRIIITYHDDGTIQDTIYNPKKRALGVVGNPYYAGLDFMWGLKPKGEKFKDGNIVDPLKGHVYGAEAWRKGDQLIVRGKFLIFGRNQTWPPAVETDFPAGFQIPDITAFVPVIPKAI